MLHTSSGNTVVEANPNNTLNPRENLTSFGVAPIGSIAPRGLCWRGMKQLAEV
jgi:hypothetical protein